jgi:hypothetical protein
LFEFRGLSFSSWLAAYALYKALCWPNSAVFSIAQKTRLLSNSLRPEQQIATPPIDAIHINETSHVASPQELCAHRINSLGSGQPKPMHFTTLLRFASPFKGFAPPPSPPLKKYLSGKQKVR